MEGVFSSGFAPWDRSYEDLVGAVELQHPTRVSTAGRGEPVPPISAPLSYALSPARRQEHTNGCATDNDYWGKGSRTLTSLPSNGPYQTTVAKISSNTAMGHQNNKNNTNNKATCGATKSKPRRTLPSTDTHKSDDVIRIRTKSPRGQCQRPGREEGKITVDYSLRQLDAHTLASPSQRRNHGNEGNDHYIVNTSQPMRNTRL